MPPSAWRKPVWEIGGSQKYFGSTYFHGQIDVQLHRDISRTYT